jgi:hypothetical protein
MSSEEAEGTSPQWGTHPHWAKISELVSQEFLCACFHRQRVTIYNICTILVNSGERRGASGGTPPMLSGGEWRSSRHRTTQPRARERSLAATNVRRAGKDEAYWLRRE